MALEDYVQQSSLRFSINDTLVRPSRRLSLDEYRAGRGVGTYLSYEGPVMPPAEDVENVPFYGRCAPTGIACRLRA